MSAMRVLLERSNSSRARHTCFTEEMRTAAVRPLVGERSVGARPCDGYVGHQRCTPGTSRPVRARGLYFVGLSAWLVRSGEVLRRTKTFCTAFTSFDSRATTV